MDGLSKEDIAKLEQTMSKLDSLVDRQEEIIKKVLAGEDEIGKRRIAYLKEYFDLYSQKLDTAIARKTSELSDAFLILERQTAEKYEAANKKADKKTNKKTGGGGDDANPPSSGGGPNSPAGGRNNEAKIRQTVAENARNQLSEPSDSDESDSDAKKKLDAWAKFFQQNEEERRNAILSNETELGFNLDTIEQRRQDKRIEQLKAHAKQVETIEESMMNLEVLRYQKEGDIQNQIAEVRLTKMYESLDAEISAQKAINEIASKLSYSGQNFEEAGEVRSRTVKAKEDLKAAQVFEDQISKFRARKELEAKRKNNGILTKEASAEIEKQIAKQFTLEKLNDKKRLETRFKLESEQLRKQAHDDLLNDKTTLFGKGNTLTERKEALYKMTHDESGDRDLTKTLSAVMLSISDMSKQLETKIDNIADYKGFIDTRLQGSSHKQSGGSYWNQLVKDMTSVGAINPYFKQEDFANNVKDLVNRGIAFDLEQRAFLMTVQEKIANTFDVADGTLLRLIRIQQEDSTAGRLGMESALNSFLNNMYETSEYLTQVADGVRGSLEEMQALMEGAEATEVEYQVQKWLGSLYSVGMSQNAVNSISTALGQIAAGQIEGLTNGGAGNLLVMAANDAGLSIADILTDGLDASDTNKLLQASVNYLAELAESSKDNKVVQQQLAEVFGVRASDLRAATNLVLPGTVSSVYGNSMTYENMLGQLTAMAGSMGSRTSLAEMMTNVWENGMYTIAGSMASNPVSYLLYKVATVLDDTTGGIAIPAISVMGNMVDLETTVADLMRVASIGTGILGSFGSIISGLGNSFSGQAMLNQLGIKSGSGLAVTPRGDDGGLKLVGGGAQTVSGSGYVGNASSSDIKDSTMQEAANDKKQLMIEAKEEEEANQIDMINNNVLKIYELLDDVTRGNRSLTVRVESYGLTRAGSSSPQGGTGALENLSNTGSGLTSSGSTSNGTVGNVTSSGIGGNLDFGGWTTVV